jgi:hypothetical protein
LSQPTSPDPTPGDNPPAPGSSFAKLRLPTTSSQQRLLRGYGPLAGFLVAFLLMALLVPTIAREKDIVSSSTTGGASVGAGQGSSASGSTGSTSSSGSGGASSSVTAPTEAASSTPGSIPTGGKSCSGPQIKGDPYSPPCISFSGSNGGATSPGVSGNAITVTYRVTNDPGFQQTLASIGGAQFSDTSADIQRTILGLADYFNKNFQFYGRKIQIKFFNGQGSQTNELLGGGQAQANADAITAAQQYHAFAELDGTTEPYDDALAKQHVISFGAPYLSANWMGQRAPYSWSVATECNDVASTASEMGYKEIGSGTTAAYAGPGLQGKPRKYAVIAPDNPWYQDCANAAVQVSESHGVKITDDIQYQLNLSTLSNQAASVVSKLSDDGITTIFCGCDPVFPVYLTSRAHEQNYFPEWVVVGVALTDQDIVGQLFDQSEWTHAFGVSFSGDTLPKAATLGYAAYKTVRSDEPANAVDLIYAQMYEMAIGLQMAGPDLTPPNFEKGMRAYPGSQAGAKNAEFGTWLFPSGHFTPQIDSRIIWWNPNAVSTFNEKKGAYVVASPRYRSGQYPTSSLHVFGK